MKTRRSRAPQRPAPSESSHPHGDQHHQSRGSGRSSEVDTQLSFDDLLAGRDQAERNADDWWMRTAMQAVRAMAATGREGLIVRVGAAPSRRPTGARSLCWTWRGAP